MIADSDEVQRKVGQGQGALAPAKPRKVVVSRAGLVRNLAYLQGGGRIIKKGRGVKVTDFEGCGSMKLRVVGLVVASLFVSACTSDDWDSATSYVGIKSDDAYAVTTAPLPDKSPPPTPISAPQTSAAETFCKGFSQSQAWNASQMGSTENDQAHISETEFRRCMENSSHWVD